MTGYTVFWLLLGLAALAGEASAILRGDQPNQPRTLTANLRSLTSVPGPWWHRTARVALVVFLAWLPAHLGLAELTAG